MGIELVSCRKLGKMRVIRTSGGLDCDSSVPHAWQGGKANVLLSVENEGIVLNDARFMSEAVESGASVIPTTSSEITSKLCSSASEAICSSSARVNTLPTGL